MNFNNSRNENTVGTKTAGPSTNTTVEHTGSTPLDRAAMKGAQKAQDHQHQNENTNSSNTVFSK